MVEQEHASGLEESFQGFTNVYQIFEIVRFKLPHHLDKVADDLLLQIFCPESHYSQRVLQRHFHTISMPPQMGQASVDVT